MRSTCLKYISLLFEICVKIKKIYVNLGNKKNTKLIPSDTPALSTLTRNNCNTWN